MDEAAKELIVGVWDLTSIHYVNYNEDVEKRQELWPFGKPETAFGRLIYAQENVMSAQLAGGRGTLDRPGEPYIGYTGEYVIKPAAPGEPPEEPVCPLMAKNGGERHYGELEHILDCITNSFESYLLPTRDGEDEGGGETKLYPRMVLKRPYIISIPPGGSGEPTRMQLKFENPAAKLLNNPYTWYEAHACWYKR